MRLLAPLLIAAALCGCNDGPCGLPPNELDGSVKDLYDIEVDREPRIRKVSSEAVTIEFFHGDNIVTKISADIRGMRKGAAIPLLDPRSVQRFTSPPTDFPSEIDNGQITFEKDITGGQETEGCFAVIFQALDGTKRSLSGAFQGKVEDISQ